MSGLGAIFAKGVGSITVGHRPELQFDLIAEAERNKAAYRAALQRDLQQIEKQQAARTADGANRQQQVRAGFAGLDQVIVPQQSSKSISLSQVAEAAKAQGVSLTAMQKQFERQGYTVRSVSPGN